MESVSSTETTARTWLAQGDLIHVICRTWPANTSGSRNSAMPAHHSSSFSWAITVEAVASSLLPPPETDSSSISYSSSGRNTTSTAAERGNDKSGCASTCSTCRPSNGSCRRLSACHRSILLRQCQTHPEPRETPLVERDHTHQMDLRQHVVVVVRDYDRQRHGWEQEQEE